MRRDEAEAAIMPQVAAPDEPPAKANASGEDVAVVGDAAKAPAADKPDKSDESDLSDRSDGKSGGELTRMMALPEPRRTSALERAVQSGAAFTIRSRSNQEVRVRYGEHILKVPPAGKPFMAQHAIHLLWTRPALLEEIAE